MDCAPLLPSVTLLAKALILLLHVGPTSPQDEAAAGDGLELLERDNLVAWCIVPFDGKRRGPAERAAMLERLGLSRVAYDWRQEHVASFEQEILEYKKHGIEYFAFWGQHEEAFRLFEEHALSPQIWQTLNAPEAPDQAQRVRESARQILPLVERTRVMGTKLGLYNHGGWAGEPENMVAVCEYLREHHDAGHVGIVYNLHHAHAHLDDFAEVLALMKPYLLCLNLNGMTRAGDERGRRILPLGEGEFDVSLTKLICASGYAGPIGVIGHTQDDVEERLRDNLNGLDWIRPQLTGEPPGPKPELKTWDPAKEGTQRSAPSEATPLQVPLEYSESFVADVVSRAQQGAEERGLLVFGSAKTACQSCHKILGMGGDIGPDLSTIGRDREPSFIVESILWPRRHVEPEYNAHVICDEDGIIYHGYIVSEDADSVVLDDPSRVPREVSIARDGIEARREVGSLMPDNLVATMSLGEQEDLFRFLFGLGRDDGLSAEQIHTLSAHSRAHLHGPATFAFDRQPLETDTWPSWRHPINRDRLYDFYAKQANHFRALGDVPPLLAEYPGLDGGTLGHWGNQNEETWASDDWSKTDLGSLQSGVFRFAGEVVPRAVCVRMEGEGERLAVCFNPETLTYEALWSGGFLETSSVRHGFLDGLQPGGKLEPRPEGNKPEEPFEYFGFYRVGKTVVFSYRIGADEYLDTPLARAGRFVRQVARTADHPLRGQLREAPAQWPETFETEIHHGTASPYAIDTIEVPADNPWNALPFFGGHDFLPDGSALICTMQGDVWHVSGFEFPSRTATWRRFATGLHQAQGLVIDDDGIFVLGRDQITRLHDLNSDGEADFYECFSDALATSAAGHDFICGLQRDRAGNFYTASGNQGVMRISADGHEARVVATGFRNPDGLGVAPDGLVTVPCSEGTWTPASMICGFRLSDTAPGSEAPYFGYPGPRDGQAPELPLVYLPRGVDNSCGGQTTVTSDRWGPFGGLQLHFSYGMGAQFLLLRDEVAGQLQGGVVPLRGEFRSGAHRGRFSESDGQLYVSGMQGWGSYTPDDGCFQRVRYTGAEVQQPKAFHVHENGVAIEFTALLERKVAEQATSHFAQCWNYRYSGAYGSAEYSPQHIGMRGHDVLRIQSGHVAADGRTLFLEIPELQPVNQLHLRVQSSRGVDHDLFLTVHRLGAPFDDFPGYVAAPKRVAAHPMQRDMAIATRSVPNPFQAEIKGARSITIRTGSNLSFETRSFAVRPGEALKLTIENPDVVPHNWALARPGTLQRVGELTNRMISDPDAALRHYVPDTSDVLAYTDTVVPRGSFTVYFRAPEQPGMYPYLCTFPGHWMVMNGEMIVSSAVLSEGK